MTEETMLYRIAGRHHVRVFKHVHHLDAAAADWVIKLAQEATAARGRFNWALSGGSSPLGLFSQLASGASTAVNWAQVQVYWADERLVPPASSESNYRLAAEHLLDPLDIPAENRFRIEGERPAEEALAQIIAQLNGTGAFNADWPYLDLSLLGLGADGHIASLFPGSPLATQKELARLVAADYQERPAERITMTSSFFNQGAHMMLIVKGAAKARALEASLGSDVNPIQWPAHRLVPQSGHVDWFVDQAAASNL